MMIRSSLFLVCLLFSFAGKTQADSATLAYTGPFLVVENPAGDTVYTCDHVTIQVYVNNPNDYTWSWSPSMGLNSTTGYIVVSKPLDTITYHVIGIGIDTVSLFVTVIQLGEFSLNASVTSHAHCLHADGTATVLVSGAPLYTYTYVWSNGDTAADADSMAAAKYTITVTNQYGCMAVDTVQIINLESNFTLSSTVTHVSCSSCTDGGIDVTASVTPVSSLGFLWSSGQTTEDLSGIGQGEYLVMVSDTFGCHTLDTFEVLNPSQVTEHSAIPGLTVYPIPVSESLTVEAAQPLSKVALFSADGRLLDTRNAGANKMILPVYTLAPGLYFLRVHSAGQTATLRFVKH